MAHWLIVAVKLNNLYFVKFYVVNIGSYLADIYQSESVIVCVIHYSVLYSDKLMWMTH